MGADARSCVDQGLSSGTTLAAHVEKGRDDGRTSKAGRRRLLPPKSFNRGTSPNFNPVAERLRIGIDAHP